MALKNRIGWWIRKTQNGNDAMHGTCRDGLAPNTKLITLRNQHRRNDNDPEFISFEIIPDDDDQQQPQHPQSEPVTQQQSPPPAANRDFGSQAQTRRFHEHREATGDDSIPF